MTTLTTPHPKRLYRCILESHVNVLYEFIDGRYVDEDSPRFYWATREIELPFWPRRKLCLMNVYDHVEDVAFSDDLHFECLRASWDCKAGLWRVFGQLNLYAPHETLPESLDREYAPWKFKWVDETPGCRLNTWTPE